MFSYCCKVCSYPQTMLFTCCWAVAILSEGLHWEDYISISFQIELDMIVREFSFWFWTKWKSIWFRKSKRKLSPRSYPIQCERKWKYSFLSVDRKTATDQTYSCPRDWRLSASGGFNWGPPWNPPYITGNGIPVFSAWAPRRAMP